MNGTTFFVVAVFVLIWGVGGALSMTRGKSRKRGKQPYDPQ